MPGDDVTPYEIDLTPYMADKRRYRVELKIEGVDINSFWRVSAYASGSYRQPELPGDFNLDGMVDAADYAVWRSQMGQTGINLKADANVDQVVDQADYQLWRENYGEVLPSSAVQAAPEPAVLPMVLMTLVPWATRRARRRCS